MKTTRRRGGIGPHYTFIAIACIVCALAPRAGAQQSGSPAPATAKPNIILILADDYAMNLVDPMTKSQYPLGLKDMMNQGTTFSNFFVGDSLCCPSRSTIFTGKFPHNTGVFGNTWSPDKGITDGGFGAFNNNNDQFVTFPLALQKATPKYTTAMMGKYLNGYNPWSTETYNQQKLWNTQWGWSQWDVAGNGYPEFIYDINQFDLNANSGVFHHGVDPGDYLTDVVSLLGQDFIKSAGEPFFIEIATFAPHAPYRPAYRDEIAFPGLRVPRTKAYGVLANKDAPDWMQDIPALEQHEMEAMDDEFRERAQCTLAIDKMISDIRTTLHAIGKDTNTYIFFTADNGYHMGEYSFLPGKMTPFDTDIQVPLVVIGPGVPHQTVSAITQTVDLVPTFTDLAGNSSPTNPDGHSLVPFLKHQTPPTWRTKALIEHHGPPDDPSDPDNEKHEKTSGDAKPPNYEALRSDTYLYVEYTNVGTAKITSYSSQGGTATFFASTDFIVAGKTKVAIAGVSPKFNLPNQLVTTVNKAQFTINNAAFPDTPDSRPRAGR